VHQNGEEVGEVRSGAGNLAIAMLRLEAARSGDALVAEGATIVPTIPGWMRLPD
jgi:hypothetical protein